MAKILLVCREELVLEAMQLNLELADYEVTPICNDIEAAYHQLQRNSFALVITDMKLEGNYAAGIQICQFAKKTQKTKVAAFTSFMTNQSANYKGFDAIIDKSDPIQVSLQVIELLLQ